MIHGNDLIHEDLFTERNIGDNMTVDLFLIKIHHALKINVISTAELKCILCNLDYHTF